jgi:undecaprenyl pyrophosphate synthase
MDDVAHEEFFAEEDLDEALADFQSRTRKFGALACATGTAG